MAEIRNYTLNLGSGRSLAARLTCCCKLACAEMERSVPEFQHG